jgi:methylated-DNA-[protein]-cysteine S-methyltransferase
VSTSKPVRKPETGKPDRDSVTLWMHTFSSPLGEIELLSSAKGVCQISLPGKKVNVEDIIQLSSREVTVRYGGVENRKASKQLNEYFLGKRKSFDFKIDLQKTGFYRRALLQGVVKIPYGQTRSYGEIARKVGSPRAARAVGTANSTNPLPFVIPCHRVVASNGLGGYGGGLPMKRKLLRLESVRRESEGS